MNNARYELLLIEDDYIDEKSFTKFVREQGLPYNCTVARSVAEAKSTLGSKRFDVIVADYMLGDGTGFEVLGIVKESPVIFVTGSGDEEVAVRAWKAGAYDYLIKDPERNYLKTIAITINNAIAHKKTEERLRLLSSAITGTNDIVYITDLDDRIIFVNRAFCEIYGYSEEDVLGKHVEILWKGLSRDSDPECGCGSVAGWETGFYHRRKNGEKFPISLSSSAINDDTGTTTAFLVVARDISDTVKMEDKLRAINLELTQTDGSRHKLP